MLDRRTGTPLAEVREQPVPQGAVPGDWTAKTQPFSVGMPQFRGPDLTEADMWGLTPLDQLWCRIEFRKLRYEGHFTPPTLTGTLQFPGNAGGFNWGSVAIDEENLLMVVNPLMMSNRLQLYPRDQIPEGLRVSTQAGHAVRDDDAAVHVAAVRAVSEAAVRHARRRRSQDARGACGTSRSARPTRAGRSASASS